MKKIILSLSILFLSLVVFSQESNNIPTFFGQCVLEVNSTEEMKALETEMKENPYIKSIRFDYNTQRVFLLTQNINSFDEEDFTSWFSNYSNKVRCVQIGVQGIDVIKPFPFEGCER